MAALTIEQAFQLALAHHQAGRLAEAEAIYRQILAAEPRHADALHYLGVIAHQSGRNDVAVELITKAIAIKPTYAEAYNNLGNVWKEKGGLNEGIAAFRQAIALRPNYAEAHSNLGTALKDKGQLDAAIAACRQAIGLKPNFAEAYYNLGTALQDKGHLDEAIAAYRETIALKPDMTKAHSNLGAALHGKVQLEEAITAYRKAIALSPNFADAHNNLGLALLVRGDFMEGWNEYKWRWKVKDVNPPWRNFIKPEWDGSSFEGCSILLHAEQGFGDAIQFIRYIPMVQGRGGHIFLECQAELHRLFQAKMPNLSVITRGQTLPSFDAHCPLLSLPRIFATDLTSIPRNVPYLSANTADVDSWRNRLADYSSNIKVGLAWAGNPALKNDLNRSLKLASLAALAGVPRVSFFSLQKGDAGTEAGTPRAGMELTDVAEELNDFADAAALIANLDLVIAVDTAVAHLAGAMGKPVWTLLPFAPDWRWLLDREDSPWYPTMRLFRQPSISDWNSVIRRVAEELADFRP